MTIKEKNVGNQGLEKRRAVVGPAKDCTVGTAAEEPVQLYFAQISCPTKPLAQNHAIFFEKEFWQAASGEDQELTESSVNLAMVRFHKSWLVCY